MDLVVIAGLLVLFVIYIAYQKGKADQKLKTQETILDNVKRSKELANKLRNSRVRDKLRKYSNER